MNENDVRKDELIRLNMQRELTPEEESRLESWLACHPECRTPWEEERALSRALRSLADVSVSSNFTSRVLQAVDSQDRHDQRERGGRMRIRNLWPRLVWGTLAVLLTAVGAHTYRVVQRNRVVSVLSVASQVSGELTEIPEPDLVLQDFEAIHRLPRTATPSDDELLIALQ